MRQRAHDKPLRQLIALQDRERRLLACEIHDGFVQEVVGAQLAIDTLLERLIKTDPDAVETLLRIRGMVRKSIDEARRLVGELRPPIVDELDLIEAIQFLVQQEENRLRLVVKFTHDVPSLRLEPLLQSTVIRIVQELLNNIARHAQTNEAEVELTVVGPVVRVSICDHGVGFDPKQIPPDRYGLSGIRERARLFGGKATVRSQPGEGTRVTVEFPIADASTK
jgi:two-component system sensor histidine kinase DegS